MASDKPGSLHSQANSPGMNGAKQTQMPASSGQRGQPMARCRRIIREVIAGSTMAVVVIAMLTGCLTVSIFALLAKSNALHRISAIILAVGGVGYTAKWSVLRCKKRGMDMRCWVFLALSILIILSCFIPLEYVLGVTVPEVMDVLTDITCGIAMNLPEPLDDICIIFLPWILVWLIYVVWAAGCGLLAVFATAIGVFVAAVVRQRKRPVDRLDFLRPIPPEPQWSVGSVAPASVGSQAPPRSVGHDAGSVSMQENPSVVVPDRDVTIPKTGMIWPTAPNVGDGISADWAEFARERLRELTPRPVADETKWALGVVDFLDELKEAEAEASPKEKTASETLRDALVAALSVKGFAPIDSNQWNPALQRAVAVVRNPGASVTTILGKGASGLSFGEKIIRKQEVKIETKGS